MVRRGDGRTERTWLRGLTKVNKRYKLQASARNLGLLMRALFGVGKPRYLQGGCGGCFSSLWAVNSHRHRMRYDEYLREGYPIATGVIEGACRHVVKDRLERSGMRWRLGGAQAMLHVRCVCASSYWDEFHQHRMESEQRRLHPHANLVRSGEPPPART